MKRNKLSVCVTTVPLTDPLDSDEKTARAESILDHARDYDVHLVAFPGSFLWVTAENEVQARAAPLVRAARQRGVGVVFGVNFAKQGWLIAWTPGMRRPVTWSDRHPTPRVLTVDGFTVSVLSGHQLDDRKLREAAAAARPTLVVVCDTITPKQWWKPLLPFRRLGVPVMPSSSTLEPELAPLSCPRGYRLPDRMLMIRGLMTGTFYIDELDGALDAA